MATSLSKLSSRLHRCLLSSHRAPAAAAASSLCTAASGPEDGGLAPEPDAAAPPPAAAAPELASSSQELDRPRTVYDRPLRDGLDVGVYKVRFRWAGSVVPLVLRSVRSELALRFCLLRDAGACIGEIGLL